MKMGQVTYAKQTWTKHLPDGGRIVTEASIASLGNQAPYFALTYSKYDSYGKDAGGGAGHETIVKHFPHLKPWVRWHLTSTDGPMHYTTNSLYWAGALGNEYPSAHGDNPPNAEYFAHTCVYGAVDSDSAVTPAEILAYAPEAIRAWLLARFPELMQAFKADMSALFGDQLDWAGSLPTLPKDADYGKQTIARRLAKLAAEQKRAELDRLTDAPG